MSLLQFAKRSLVFYWRTNLGVLSAAMVSTAVLAGALVVGDCVRHSLKMMVTARLGTTQLAVAAQSRFFRAKLADELAAELNTTMAPVLQLRGLIANSDGTRRAFPKRIEVLGVDERFYRIGAGGNPFGSGWSEGIVLNEPLAEKLGVRVGDEIVLRIGKPGLMPRDVPLTPDADLSVAFRLVVKAVAEESEFGRFSLQASQVAPLNVFVPLRWLQEKLGRSAQANMLLVAAGPVRNSTRGDMIRKEEISNGAGPKGSITVEKADNAVRKCWQLADAGLELRELEHGNIIEIRSRQVFIDESLGEAAMGAGDGAVGVLTYFVNELRLGGKTTPYSMVTAMGRSADENGIIESDMQDDEILINQWLAEDLGAKVGDAI
jgi:hypothetical protein